MNKQIFFAILLLSSILFARDNPFAPVAQDQLDLLHKPISICEFNQTKVTPTPKPEIKIAKTFPVDTIQPKPQPQPIIAKTIKIIPAKTEHIKHIKHKRVVHKTRYKQIYKNENLKIYLNQNHIKISTNDTLLKSWILRYPKRLVLDFGDDFVIYPSYQKNIRSRYIKSLKIGTHDCFYRVTLQLKNRTKYKIKNTSYGYLITLLP